MFSAVASGIFAYRNAEKTKNGDIGRSAVCLGQTTALLDEIAKYDNIASSAAKSTISVFSNLSKQSKAFEYAGKFANFAANNVNPLICASGVIKTARSDEKVKTGITEVAALSAMFAGEGMIKLNYDKVANSDSVKELGIKLSEAKLTKPIAEYISKNKLGGKLGMIAKGVIFVGGSMASYAFGEALGGDVAKRVECNLGLQKNKKINQIT